MLKNNKVNLIIAFILAIFLWAYVLEGTKIISTETIRNVPIKYINEGKLEKQGLVVLKSDVDTVNIVFSGERSLTSKVKNKDFQVVVDLGSGEVGENKLPVSVIDSPENVKIENISDKEIIVTIDHYKEVSKPVKAAVARELSGDEELIVHELGIESVIVKGPETLVDKVKTVNAVADGSRINSENNRLEARLVPVDEHEHEVENVNLSVQKTYLYASINKMKSVALSVKIKGKEQGDFIRTIEMPETVKVTGSEKVLKGLLRIQCKPLDLSDVYENTTMILELQLPNGVSLAKENQKISAKITVKKKNENIGNGNSPVDDPNDAENPDAGNQNEKPDDQSDEDEDEEGRE